MIRILFVSSRIEKINQYLAILNGSKFKLAAPADESHILDTVSIAAPDIVILDTLSTGFNFKNIVKKLKPYTENTVILLLTGNDFNDRELIKSANAFLQDDFLDEMILNTINMNLRTRESLERLSNTNKDLADSLYRLNALYSTSSQFAGTLDKKKLINFMIEGIDKALSFSLTCTLSFCTEEEPVLLINSLYELSDEILSALKLRTVYHYKALFEGKTLPYDLDINNLKVVKHIKYPANRFTFTLFQFDNMFAPVSLGDNFFGCVEIFKDAPFSAEDATCFQTIAQQVTLPLKSATLYQEIKETNLKLEKLERLKSEFISIVSHELRTPLTSIKNSLDILLSGRCGEVTEASDKFLSMAKRNVQRLSGIINDLLDLSKIEAGKMDFHFKNININSVIEYVKSALSVVAKEKGLSLLTEECENLPEIYADSQRLEQVLTNLVSNAIKFTPEGRSITIKSRLMNAGDLIYNECFADIMKKLEGDCVVVSVQDEGIGIAEKDLLHVFDKFAQIENSLSRKVGGSGLGLPIAKQLLEAHNGAIWCDSKPDCGSTFYFAIPVEKVLAPAGTMLGR